MIAARDHTTSMIKPRVLHDSRGTHATAPRKGTWWCINNTPNSQNPRQGAQNHLELHTRKQTMLLHHNLCFEINDNVEISSGGHFDLKWVPSHVPFLAKIHQRDQDWS